MAATDLVTILSTDWVESTATRTRLGEERADRLQERHDETLRTTIEQHDGDVVKNSGDGALATFGSATNALAAAVAIQQRFDAQSRQANDGERIALRIGVSVGDVLRRDDDIFGAAVVEAVRLQASAAPNQILCSDLVRALARGRGGFEFELVGLLELKGLPDPVAACAVQWAPVAPADSTLTFPPELAIGAASSFVGRRRELEFALARALQSEQTHTLWLLGEAGIGKTRLAGEIAQRAHDRGALVLYGRVDEQVRAPFQPFIDGLRWFTAQMHDDALAQLVGVDPEPLVRLVPELATRVPGLRRPEAANETEQYRLFESVRSWLSTIAADRPVVFVVDDVHWADGPTLAMLGHVARAAQPCRLTILATARDTSPDLGEPLNDLVDELKRIGRSDPLRLTGLTVDEIASLLDSSTPASTIVRLVAETAGNPLFVRAVIAGMLPDGSLPAEMPTDVRSAVRRRVGRIEPTTQQVLQAAAIAGLEFSLGVASDVAELGDEDGLACVEQAVNAGLVEEVAVDRFRFTHALVRDALVSALSASRQARIHMRIAEAIERRFAARLDDHFGALAQHYANAAAPEVLERALDYAKRSAQRAIDLLAFEAAVEDYAFALELVERMPAYPTRSRIELVIARGRAQTLDSDHPTALDTFRAAATLARAEGDWASFATAAVEFEETCWRRGTHGPEALALLREALDHTTVAIERVQLSASIGRALHYSGRWDAARVAAEDALAAAREVGDPALLAHALVASIQTLARYRPGEAELAVERAEEVHSLEHVPKPVEDRAGTAAQYAAIAALVVADRPLFETWFDRYVNSAEASRFRFSRYVALCDVELRSFLDGDLALAEQQANDALEWGQARDDVTGIHGTQMFLIRREQGRLGELVPVIKMLLQVNPTAAMWRPGLALLLADVGMHDDAHTLLDELTADNIAAIPRDILFTGALCFVAEAAHVLARPRVAEVVERELVPWNGYGACLGHVTGFMGAVDRYLALLAWTQGRLDDADAWFESALAFNRRVGAVPWIAHTLADWAVLRAERGDLARADELATEARVLSDRHGLVAVRTRLDALSANDGSAADGRV
jgi:class 3 adenylate cyclase/tetratricopeptide (TPR) repeat protein